MYAYICALKHPIRVQMQRGALVTQEDRRHRTPLHFAAFNHQVVQPERTADHKPSAQNLHSHAPPQNHHRALGIVLL